MTDLCQHFTPLWVAEALIDRHFPALDTGDMVLEPSCGLGAFLKAVPASVPAVGVEIDEALAVQARLETGREIVTGDFCTVSLSIQPTVVIGNPPFRADVPDGGRAGFILPTYFFQTAGRVCRYAERWSIAHELLPRNSFHSRMRTPLLFAIFSKDQRRTLIGFACYQEATALHAMAAPYRSILSATSGSMWRSVCELALRRLGGLVESDIRTIQRHLADQFEAPLIVRTCPVAEG